MSEGKSGLALGITEYALATRAPHQPINSKREVSRVMN